MITVSPKQAQERYASLPAILQDAIFSPRNADILEKIGRENKLDKEDVTELAVILSLVFLGFLRPEYAGDEIADRLYLDDETIDAITEKLNALVFNELRGTLEKVYAPQEETVPTETAAPVSFVEITPEKSAGATPVQELSAKRPAAAPPLEIFSAPSVPSVAESTPGTGAFSIEETPPGPPDFPKAEEAAAPVPDKPMPAAPAAAVPAGAAQPEIQPPPAVLPQPSAAPVVLNTEFQAEPIGLDPSFPSGAFGISAGDQLKELGSVPRPVRIEARLEMETTPAPAGPGVPGDKTVPLDDVSPLIHYDQPKPFDFGQQTGGGVSLDNLGAPPAASAAPQEAAQDRAAQNSGFLHSFLSSLKSSKKEASRGGSAPAQAPVVKEVNYSADASLSDSDQREPSRAQTLGVPPENVVDMKNSPAPDVPPLPKK